MLHLPKKIPFMLATKEKPIFIFLFFVIFWVQTAKAQLKTFNFCDTNRVMAVYSGNQVSVQCDTAFIMSKEVFARYSQSFENFKKFNKNYNSLIVAYDSLDDVLSNQITVTTEAYAKMNSLYSEMDTKSRSILYTFDTGLGSIQKDLKTANNNIDQAKKDLEAAKQDIKRSIKTSWNTRLLWGAGGLLVGMFTSTILIMGR